MRKVLPLPQLFNDVSAVVSYMLSLVAFEILQIFIYHVL